MNVMSYSFFSCLVLRPTVHQKGSLIGAQRPMGTQSSFHPDKTDMTLSGFEPETPQTTQHILANKIKYTRPSLPADSFSII